ncbi:MAG: hypothetical protein EHM23_09825 [Acidobacteria bacterium]|nr:MAG: hypothetical protein EHM23_09825 [Acidobacteriota bacterium]
MWLEEAEMRLVERVRKRSEARKDRSQPRYAASQAKTKTAGVAEVKEGAVELPRTEEWLEPEPAMAEAKAGAEAVGDEAVKTPWGKKRVEPKSPMTKTEVAPGAAKTGVTAPALRPDVGRANHENESQQGNSQPATHCL